MSTHAKGRFEVKTWDENPYDETDGGLKLTSASVTKSFRGGIEGEGTLEYLMVYPGGGYAKFVGLERVVGRLGDRWGSFVLEHSGTFEGDVAEASWSVVPGSGTGELRGLRGEGVLRLRGRPALPHHPRLRLGVNERTAKEIPL